MWFGRKPAFRSMSMREAQRALAQDQSIRLLDVRTDDEYHAGHIPGCRHLPLDRIAGIGAVVPDKDEQLFIYCLSGARSRMACAQLARMGYTGVTDIGGITQWPGELERTVGA